MATFTNIPTWGSGATIQWYGERGILNALVTHIAALPLPADGARSLLSAICWADGASPPWIDALTDVRFLVELSLADFGNPDLVIACRVEGEAMPYLVFVEAKVHPYVFSAGSNRGGMSAGYNSTINGQLALKYRFACALANATSTTPSLIEPKALYLQYKAQLADMAGKARHLEKGTVIEILRGLGLLGLPEERCHYVALTWDDREGRVLNAPEDLRPLFLDQDDSDDSGQWSQQYEVMRPRFGWLGYQSLSEALKLENDRSFTGACDGMLRALAPSAADYRQRQTLEDLTDEENQFVMQVAELLAEACRVGSRRKVLVRREKASLSVSVDGAVVIKVIPAMQDGGIFVGIRTRDKDIALPVLQGTLLERSIQGVVFHGITLGSASIDLTVDVNLAVLVAGLQERYA